MQLRLKTLAWLAAVAVLAAFIGVALRPSAIVVETAIAAVGPLEVTTDELGETRSHDRFVVAAPVNGRLRRVLLHDGAEVAANQVVATIAPVPLSARERDELLARIAAAAAAQRTAAAQLQHVLEDLAQARRERRASSSCWRAG